MSLSLKRGHNDTILKGLSIINDIINEKHLAQILDKAFHLMLFTVTDRISQYYMFYHTLRLSFALLNFHNCSFL